MTPAGIIVAGMRAIVPEDLNRGTRQVERRRTLHRAIGANALAAIHKVAPEDIAARAWPHDTATKAAVDITTTITGAPYAPTVNSAVLTNVAPASAAARLFEHPNVISLDFDGVNIYAIPRGSLIPVPVFIAEGAPMPMVQVALDLTLVGPPRKILVGTALSAELETYSANTAASTLGAVIGAQAS